MKKIVALVLSLVMVMGLATTAFAAVDTKLAEWNATTSAWDVTYEAEGKTPEEMLVDNDYVLGDVYNFGTDYFVATTEAAAVYKLTYGAKVVFLAKVDLADYTFMAKAKVLPVVDADDAVCGDWFVANLDTDDVYYASYDKTGAVDGVYVASKTAGTYVLVDGKLVEAAPVEFQAVAPNANAVVTWMLHDYAGNDVENYVFVNAKCTECGKVAKLFATATAAGKKSMPAAGGYVTAADFFGFGAVEAPATDKVESAQTFDAGIAMYVGMSVMAAAGSAVVLKKKD